MNKLQSEITQIRSEFTNQAQKTKSLEMALLAKQTLSKEKLIIEAFQKQAASLRNLLKDRLQYHASLEKILQELQSAQGEQIARNIYPHSINPNQLYTYSKIVISQGENATIQKFFTKKITSMTLLYLASDDEFSAEKFHQKCDNIPNTLTLCETTYNKKIGGFTPLTWESTVNEKYKIDESGDSFIFSLSHNDKFVLKEKDLAIKNRKNFGPRFGNGTDFFIPDHADQTFNSKAYINTSYHNNNYKWGDKASWQRFCGNPNSSCYFKAKEWQVWQIQFEQIIEPNQETK